MNKAEERIAALNIALRLMEGHLKMATPGGAGRDSKAYQVAQGRLTTLTELRDEIAKGNSNGRQH